MTKLQLLEATAPAVETLFNLDIRLSNCYIGNKGPRDMALHRLRGNILRALEELKSYNLFEAGEGYFEEEGK